MKEWSLVTGANGHLGNTLVRELVLQGERVRASVRNVHNKEPFKGLDCEVVYANILDKQSLVQAMQGVNTLYHVAAVFKHWSANPDKDIIEANVIGTRNVLEVAAECGVKKVVYVSSIAALDDTKIPMDESTWNSHFPNPYYKSKTEAEKLAWEIADKLDLWMVTVLPSSMVGPNTYGHLTPTMGFLNLVVKNKLPFDPNFAFNYVHVSDVAKGMVLASCKGIRGERYILATAPSISTTQVIDIAGSLFPAVNKPDILPKEVLMDMAINMEEESKTTHKPPLLLIGNIEHYYGADARIDISKARRELGYSPLSPEEAIKEALLHLAKENF
jgi:dihydroflavonol-4-reductase